MASAFGKQPSSRPQSNAPTCYQVVQNTQGSFVASAAFGPGTQQIRVVAQNQGWATIGTTSDATIATSAGGVGMVVTGLSTFGAVGSFVNYSTPEYFSVTPGQKFCFASTSTSSGALTITEMA